MPQDASKPVTLRLKLDYAVCEKLCVPAEGKLELLSRRGRECEDAALTRPKRTCRKGIRGDIGRPRGPSTTRPKPRSWSMWPPAPTGRRSSSSKARRRSGPAGAGSRRAARRTGHRHFASISTVCRRGRARKARATLDLHRGRRRPGRGGHDPARLRAPKAALSYRPIT